MEEAVHSLETQVILYYTEPSIITGLVLSCGLKLTLGLLATITLKVVPFLEYALFPELLPFLKCILEDVFCEGVQHRLQISLDQHSCVKIVAF
jgi:hypothetical protein